MKTTLKHVTINGVFYEYMPELNGGYYDSVKGLHLMRSSGKFVFNIDENGVMFFNKI